jgi:hypothetical protein
LLKKTRWFCLFCVVVLIEFHRFPPPPLPVSMNSSSRTV